MKGCRSYILHFLIVCLLAGGAQASLQAQDLAAIGDGNPFTIDGSVSAQSTTYEASDIAARRQSFTWLLSGNLNIGVYDVAIPLSFSISDRGSDFSQPFNQFGLSPHYEWVTAHLGHRNLRFSRYTLAGHQILGAGLELTPGILRFAVIGGQFRAAVEEDTTTRLLQIPSYERTGYSVKLGVGSGQNFFDLIYLKASDDTNSIGSLSSRSQIQPGENAVFGINSRFQPMQQLSVWADVGVSAYTRNVRSLEVLDQSAEVEAASSVIDPKMSTQVYTALHSGLRFTQAAYGMSLEYTRVDPDYQSMGAYFLASDVHRIAFSPNFSVMNHTLRFNGTLAWQQDNLQDKKMATTTRISPILNISYNPAPEFGVDLQYTDMFTSQEDGTVRLTDTTRMDQSMPSISLTPRLVLRDSTKVHTVVATAMHSQLQDNNEFSRRFTRFESSNVSLNYNLALVREALSFSASVSGNRLDNLAGRITSMSYSLGAEKSFANPQLSLSLTFAGSTRQQGSATNIILGVGYRPAEQHSFNMSTSLTSASYDVDNSSFTEFTTTARYVFSF